MQYEPNTFTHAIRNGTPQIGLWITTSNNFTAEAVATAGFDWVVLDTEHSPSDIQTVLGQLQAFEASPTVSLVRPVWNDPLVVKRLLDLGVPGLVFPMVQNADEATAAVASTRYPPRGIRGFSGTTRANKFGRTTDYLDRVEDETTVIVQIETRAALEAADEIAAVDGVDGVFFGPADLAADIGVLGRPMADEVWDLVRPVAARLQANGTPCGTLVSDAEIAAQLLNEDFTFVACGTDLGLLARGADALQASVRAGIA
ncbi:MAG: 4-hydroxy-2-oxoheptanedioate aldolase [Candidatus Aldehydirespiratoraceae bacterium]|jgi:4-hydroxy-2-oxoheptanedioate aldolase